MQKFIHQTNGNLVFGNDSNFVPYSDSSVLPDLISIERRPIGEPVSIDPVPFAVKHGALFFPPSIELPSGTTPLYSMDKMEEGLTGHVEKLSEWLDHSRCLADIMRLYSFTWIRDVYTQIALISMAIDQVITFDGIDGKPYAALFVRGNWDGATVEQLKNIGKVPMAVYAYLQAMGCAIAAVDPIDGTDILTKVDWLDGHAGKAARSTAVRYMDLHSAPAGTLLSHAQEHMSKILRDEAPALNFCRICGCAVSPLESRQTFESGFCKFKLYQDRERTISQLVGLGIEQKLAHKLIEPYKDHWGEVIQH